MRPLTIAAAGLAWLMLSLPAAEAGGSQSRTAQYGKGSFASTLQQGGGNRSFVIQKGTGNSAQVVQEGSGNVSRIVQIGDGNTASVRQTGNGNRSVIVQVGDGHSAASRQTGGQRFRSLQTGLAGRQPQGAPGVGYWAGSQ